MSRTVQGLGYEARRDRRDVMGCREAQGARVTRWLRAARAGCAAVAGSAGGAAAFGLALVALGSTGLAAAQVDERQPLPSGSVVEIENGFGAIAVSGWDKDEIWVKGSVPPGFDVALDVDTDEDEDERTGKRARRTRASVRVDVGQPRDAREWGRRGGLRAGGGAEGAASLEIFVPRGSEVRAESINGAITVRDVTGGLELQSINGRIRVDGGGGVLRAQTMTGPIEFAGAASSAHVESVAGTIRLGRVTGEARVETVSGNVTLDVDRLAELVVSTTSGAIGISGTMAGRAEWRIETFSGGVTLDFASAPAAEFRLSSASGTIESSLGPKQSRTDSPFTVLEFSTGTGSEVEVETYSGAIIVRTAGTK